MPTYVALLRAINVGGAGKLAMHDLKLLCEEAKFTNVRTYIQSGNVVFRSRLSEGAAKAALEKALGAHLGKPCGVLIRTGDELAAVLARNPFADEPRNRVMAIFLDAAPATSALDGVKGAGGEVVHLSGREIFIHYPSGMGRSKLKLPALAARGTARNINTITKLADMAGQT